MAQARISDLPAAVLADLTDTDVMEVSDLGAAPARRSKKTTLTLLKQYMHAAAVFTTSLTSLAGFVALGAAPGATNAVNIDAASFNGAVGGVRLVNGTATGHLALSTSTLRLETLDAVTVLRLGTNASARWEIATTASVSSFAALQATARLIGGATNGWAFRNSANTRDNWQMTDNGVTLFQNDGTSTARYELFGGSGELTAGMLLYGGNAATAVNIVPNSTNTAASVVVLGYHDGTQYRSAVEVPNVATLQAGTLRLMRSGGNIVIGGTTAGATVSGALAFASAATEPTTTVDRVHVYGFDRAAGARALSIFQEATATGYLAEVPTDLLPIRFNGANMRLFAIAG